MKVLHVIPSIAPRYGGPSRAVVDMCRSLAAGGTRTLIATTDADGRGRLDVEYGRETVHAGVPAMFFARQWSEAYKYSRPLARWLDAHVRDFDVVHIHAVFSHACLAAARACRRLGVPYVVRPLGTLDPWSLRQKRLKKSLFWHLGVRRALTAASAVHYTTQSERRLAEESLRLSNGVVIPLGVEVESPGEAGSGGGGDGVDSEAHPYVLVLSRLHKKKGLELLLPAFISLRRRPEFRKWRLILAGDGEPAYVDSLRRLAESNGGGDGIVFAGWVEGDSRKATLQKAGLLALTSYQENFGLCVVEALACGVPVLVSRHVNLSPEIEGAGAGWVVALEPEALERALAEALLDGGARALRGESGRELVSRRFTWGEVAEELLALYESVVRVGASTDSARGR